LIKKSEQMNNEGMDSQAIKNSIVQQLNFSMKNYLDKNERMVTRMQANIEQKKNENERSGSLSSRSNSIDFRRQ